MAAMVYLLAMLRKGRLNARTLTVAAVFYAVFGLCLIPILS
jgi:O-antigen/teichoic acid export membrane protein